MASLVEVKNRNVVPNWREYNKTAKLGEFGSVSTILKPAELFPIDEYIQSWKDNKTIAFAGDLISAAIMNCQQSNPDALEAARFIVSHPDEATGVLVRTAKSMIATPEEIAANAQLSVSEKLNRITNRESAIINAIRLLKKNKDFFCYNPIAYCEMARCYVTLGQLDKAKEAMEIALHLAPHHRYVCRSAARLFLHIEDPDRARYIIAKNPYLFKDPWLLASEIAINTLMDRTSRNIKKGSELITSSNYSPFSISELSSAIGSIEMMNGNKKKCRSYFKSALQNPNDNSLAQAQFLLSQNSDLSFEFGDNIVLPNAYEADALSAYINDDYSKALGTAVDWIEDMPFTRRPVQFAANIAYTFQKDYDMALRILELGRSANPGDLRMLNNIAYVYALKGDTTSAEKIINEAKRNPLPVDVRICLTATEGLNEYRKGNYEKGKVLYLQAIKMAEREFPNKEIVATAILNFAREEVRYDQSFTSDALGILDKIPDFSKETIQLKEDVKAELKQ